MNKKKYICAMFLGIFYDIMIVISVLMLLLYSLSIVLYVIKLIIDSFKKPKIKIENESKTKAKQTIITIKGVKISVNIDADK